MINDPDQGIRVLKGNTWSLAGENPVTLLNEVTPIVAGGTGNSQLGGWLPSTFLGNQNEQNCVFSNEIFQKKGKCQKNV